MEESDPHWGVHFQRQVKTMIAEVHRRRKLDIPPQKHVASVVFWERLHNYDAQEELDRSLLLGLACGGWYETRCGDPANWPTVDGDAELDKLEALDTEELVALALAGFIALVDESLGP